jgi:hypothetical protein
MCRNRLLANEYLFPIIFLAGVTTVDVTAAPITGMSQLGGWVYIDRNNDGNLAFSNDPNPEYVIGGVGVSLFSATVSDDFGRYLFENITPGTYLLRETQPVEYVDGIDTLGVLQSFNGQPIPGNASAGSMADNTFLNIVLTADVGGEFYNFGERGLAAGYASIRHLFGSRPGLGTPPPTGQGGPEGPEPTSLAYALIAGCGGWLTLRRNRSSRIR